VLPVAQEKLHWDENEQLHLGDLRLATRSRQEAASWYAALLAAGASSNYPPLDSALRIASTGFSGIVVLANNVLVKLYANGLLLAGSKRGFWDGSNLHMDDFLTGAFFNGLHCIYGDTKLSLSKINFKDGTLRSVNGVIVATVYGNMQISLVALLCLYHEVDLG
jgi:hypothetical protein